MDTRSSWKPLHFAAESGDVEAARRLVAENPAAVRARDDGGRTPLYVAAECGRAALARWLVLEGGAAVNAKARDGRTPLHAAIFGYGRQVSPQEIVEVVRALVVDCNANADARDDLGRTPLFLTHTLRERGGDHETGAGAARVLIEEGGAAVDARTDAGRTPLHGAAEAGDIDLARLLLGHGAAVDAADVHGLTPMHRGVGNVEMVRMLIVEFGADVNAESGVDGSPLLWAVADDNVEMARLLVEQGADVSARNDDSWTALHYAALRSFDGADEPQLIIAQLLIAHGAEVDAKNAGSTALHLAARNRNVEIVRALIEGGAAVDLVQEDGWTALLIAAKFMYLEVARVLIVEGRADVNIARPDGDSPLHLVSDSLEPDADECGPEFAELLVREGGAAVNAQNIAGMTALHMAALRDRADVVEVLISEGRAAVNVQDVRGMTALHYALLADDRVPGERTPTKLLDHGAAVDIENAEGWTPIHQACRTVVPNVALIDRMMRETGLLITLAQNVVDSHYRRLAKRQRRGGA